MARTGWGRHTVVATGSNDSTKQVSVNAWNNDLDTDGIIGFAPETVASASSVTPTNSYVKLSGSTSVDTIALANSSDGDLLYVITTGSVTLNNTSSPSTDGDIRLLGDANKDLSTTTPTILIRNGTYWYEYGGSPVTDGSIANAQLANMAANTIKVRNANSSGVPSDIALATTQLLIGDGTGFTAAALSGDVTMDNTGDVTVGTLNQSTTGSSASCTGLSATATALATGRTISTTGDVTWTSASFDGSGNVTGVAAIGTGVIVDADIKSDAAIANTKLATNPLDYANMAAPAAAVAFNSQKLTGVADPAAAQDAATKAYVDSQEHAVTPSSTTTFTNKSIDLTDNTLTGTSLELKTAISDETGSGSLVFATSPTLVTPALGTPASGVATNLTGTAASLTAGNATLAATVTTNANLTGGVTSVGNAATVITNANLTGGVTSVGNAATVVTNANLTGEVTSVGNAATIADDIIREVNLEVNTATNDDVLTADSTAAGGFKWAAGGGGSDTPWTEDHSFTDYYFDMEIQTKPSDPAADHGRFYVKEIDTDNDGVFCLIRKNGGFEETQIV